MVQAGWQVSALSPPTRSSGARRPRKSRPLARHGPAAPASGTPRWLLTLLPATERCHPAGAASCGRAQPAEGLQAGVGAEPVPPCLPPVCEPSPRCSRPSLCLCPLCRASPCAPRAVPAARTGSPGGTRRRVCCRGVTPRRGTAGSGVPLGGGVSPSLVSRALSPLRCLQSQRRESPCLHQLVGSLFFSALYS